MNLMKRIIAGLFAFAMIVGAFPINAYASEVWPSEISIGSKGGLVMNFETGTVLYESNGYDALYPASITKVMSALLVIENCKMDEVVTFSEEAVYGNEGDGSNIARDIGEQMTVEECLYAVLLESANECTYALAEHVAGSAEAFVDMMNERAAALGCVNTHFVTVNGLHDENHYTCCYDMALIAREAYKNETFRIMTATKAYDIPPTNKHKEYTYLRNDNSMLAYYTTNKYLYDYCTGGKPGYTPNAGFTQVEYAEKDGMTLIAVVMGAASGVQYKDCINMFDYCFDHFKLWNIAANEDEFQGESETFFDTEATMFHSSTDLISLDAQADIILPINTDFSAAIRSIDYNTGDDSVAGIITYTFDGREVGSAKINITMPEAEFSYPSDLVAKETEDEIHISPFRILFWIIIAIVIVALLIFLRYIQVNYYIIKNQLERKRKRKAKMKGRRPTRANINFGKKKRRR